MSGGSVERGYKYRRWWEERSLTDSDYHNHDEIRQFALEDGDDENDDNDDDADDDDDDNDDNDDHDDDDDDEEDADD